MTQEELVVKLSLDDSSLQSGLNSASNSITGMTGQATKSTSGLGNALGKVGKVAGVAATAAAAGLAAIGKSAISSYADYEQLIGGVETLFKDSAGVVENYANNAYRTAGLSANAYMETVTSFSASLLQSVGNDTAQAALIADMAITDMADNANKMGTSMESIQNAYQGFAKQNYTMLDNLKLGYGGTKSEMERLLADAEKLSGIKYDISNLDDVYNAIHIIQTELGITGTTAKEASTTIQGSVASMQSAWANLLTGIADDNADFESLISNFVDSISTLASNIIPRIQVVLEGLGQLVEKMVPALLEMVPPLIESVLPSLIDSAFNAVLAIVNCIVDNLPMFVQTGIEALLSVAEGIAESIPELIPQLVDVVITIVNTLLEHIPEIIDASVAIMEGLIIGIVNSIPKIIASIPQIITAIIKAFLNLIPKLVEVGGQLIAGLAKGIVNGVSGLVKSITDACSKVVSKVKDFFGIHSPSKLFAGLGENMMEGLAVGIKDNESPVNAIGSISSRLENAFSPTLQTSGTTGVSSKTSLLSTANNNSNMTALFTQMTRQIVSAINDVDMNVSIGDTVIAQSAKRGADSYQRRTGKALFV